MQQDTAQKKKTTYHENITSKTCGRSCNSIARGRSIGALGQGVIPRNSRHRRCGRRSAHAVHAALGQPRRGHGRSQLRRRSESAAHGAMRRGHARRVLSRRHPRGRRAGCLQAGTALAQPLRARRLGTTVRKPHLHARRRAYAPHHRAGVGARHDPRSGRAYQPLRPRHTLSGADAAHRTRGMVRR